jgi:hypothetical protein
VIDGCTLWFDGVGSLSWRACCDAHDVAYSAGGSWVEKLQADWALATCVNDVLPGMGLVMLVGVLIGGPLFFVWRSRKRRVR